MNENAVGVFPALNPLEDEEIFCHVNAHVDEVNDKRMRLPSKILENKDMISLLRGGRKNHKLEMQAISRSGGCSG